MNHRREIDGLRALAVMPVILFHAGFPSFRGGYVGVDVFFVISGYLITSIILAEKQVGTFQLINFYERRARRILPALLFVAFASLPFSWFWLLPADMKSFSQSLVAVASFSSNILFYLTSGYFQPNAELKPLLHTWSLAVEEQYYLLFPIFLAMTWRLGRRWIAPLLIIIATLSLAAAQWGSLNMPVATFYLLPTRVWELMIGALLAFYLANRSRSNHQQPTSEAGSSIGVLLIVCAVFLFDKQTPFPSLYALVPTIGAVLVVAFATEQTLAGKLLGSRPLVGIGLISYSAYLWHQPVFAFAKHRSLSEPSLLLMTASTVASLVFAYFTWKYIETPFRHKKRFSGKQVFSYGAIASTILVAFGMAGHMTDGFIGRTSPSHLPNNYFELASRARFQSGIDGNTCVSEKASLCKVSQVAGAKNILLVGDSHSADYSVEFRRFVNERRLSASQFSIGGCGFIRTQRALNRGECGRARRLLKEALENEKFDKILFVGAFYGYIGKSEKEAVADELDALSELISDMVGVGAEVIFFVPRYSLSHEPMRAALLNKLSDVRVIEDPTARYIDERLGLFNGVPNFKTFNERDFLIKLGGAEISRFNGHTSNLEPLYRDTNHLTDYAAQLVFRKLASSVDF